MLSKAAMKPLLRALLLLPLLALPSMAQEAPPKDLFQQALGYWVVDFDSAATQAMIAKMSRDKDDKPHPEDAASLRKDMAASTFHVREGFVSFYDPGSTEHSKLEIKSQDAAKKLIEADIEIDENETKQLQIQVEGDRITFLFKDDGEQFEFGLKRIDKATFDKRVADLAKLRQEDEDEEDVVEADGGDKEPQLVGGYPMAIPVPDKPGFVFSPYNNMVVDVRDIPSGTLVMDPTYPAAEKKIFRLP